MRDRCGAVLTASMSVLAVEAVIATIGVFVWGQTQESPGASVNAMGFFLLILVAPFVAAAGAAMAALLSVGVVIPLIVAARWLGRRLTGDEAWWWIPAVAALGAAPATVAAGAETGLPAVLAVWVGLTAGLTAPALVARRLLLPHCRWLSGGAMAGRVAWYGALAVVAAALAGAGVVAEWGYEPPRLSAERVAGTWSDGKGGTLALLAGGKAVAAGVDTFDRDDTSTSVTRECAGTGTWEYDPGSGPWTQQVRVTVDDCPMAAWSVFGTRDHPKLFVFIGDPDGGDLYVMRRGG
ncbi:hypothetical protein ACF1AL_27725 [Streptomyces sp. NPDC014801]|uniref:hypothetical protein n=1 Tax=Streptomyces sp. NPDC014801 TaxID=3364916 RepID=UPI0036F54DF9